MSARPKSNVTTRGQKRREEEERRNEEERQNEEERRKEEERKKEEERSVEMVVTESLLQLASPFQAASSPIHPTTTVTSSHVVINPASPPRTLPADPTGTVSERRGLNIANLVIPASSQSSSLLEPPRSSFSAAHSPTSPASATLQVPGSRGGSRPSSPGPVRRMPPPGRRATPYSSRPGSAYHSQQSSPLMVSTTTSQPGSLPVTHLSPKYPFYEPELIDHQGPDNIASLRVGKPLGPPTRTSRPPAFTKTGAVITCKKPFLLKKSVRGEFTECHQCGDTILEGQSMMQCCDDACSFRYCIAGRKKCWSTLHPSIQISLEDMDCKYGGGDEHDKNEKRPAVGARHLSSRLGTNHYGLEPKDSGSEALLQ
ncbi:hypothetical protein BJ508DRAFT_311244 [Ascobolus immersus RN42]|uniref:Uncharacterized protein n=1 Tax=Ascobolus immersus RN42 TaxID=1160509 RepID=A0A3N4I2Z3_ASCIM|nr:hypothetical protein BJ508DRAFT_311244 [Ascobolus immersus RN42]